MLPYSNQSIITNYYYQSCKNVIRKKIHKIKKIRQKAKKSNNRECKKSSKLCKNKECNKRYRIANCK